MSQLSFPALAASGQKYAQVALPLPLNQAFTYKVPEKIFPQLKIGLWVKVPFRAGFLLGVIVGLGETLEPEFEEHRIKEIVEVAWGETPVPQKLLELTRWMSERYASSWGEALALLKPLHIKRARDSEPLSSAAQPSTTTPFTLTVEQEKAVNALEAAMTLAAAAPQFLLQGVTASGKTEVYLRAIEKAFSLGKTAIFLAPEISLCVPLFTLAQERLGAERVGLWHSQINRGEKEALLRAIHSGKIRLILGARSALFVPLENLGLVILDEEHDSSYKQDEKPRYHAKAVAAKLCQLHGAILVLGSATPSIESRYEAETGRIQHLTLTQKVLSNQMPKVQVIDRKKYLSQKSPFTPELKARAERALFRREQVILALNRRGHSTFLLCAGCGDVRKCPNCFVSLVFHREAPKNPSSPAVGYHGKLRCHYCEWTEDTPKVCPKCNHDAFFWGGFGTQKVEELTRKEFPFARIARLDRDSARRKNFTRSVVDAFKNDSADILVGTQMVAQGLDLPRVSFVGIVDADTALFHPDFRSSERTFQWITQAVGRAGRREQAGEAVVQTTLPDHPAIIHATTQDYESFYQVELQQRRLTLYPPFAHLLLLRLETKNKNAELPKEIDSLARNLAMLKEKNSALQILGPTPSPREFLRGFRRWQMLLKCLDEPTRDAALKLAQDYKPKAGMRYIIDVNPYDLL